MGRTKSRDARNNGRRKNVPRGSAAEDAGCARRRPDRRALRKRPPGAAAGEAARPGMGGAVFPEFVLLRMAVRLVPTAQSLTLLAVLVQDHLRHAPAALGRLMSCSRLLYQNQLQLPLNLSSLPIEGSGRQLDLLRAHYSVTSLTLSALLDFSRVASPELCELRLLPSRERGLGDLRPLKGCLSLQTLVLSRVVGLSNVAPLGYLKSLAVLDLSHLPELRDVSALGNSCTLRELNLTGNLGVASVAALAQCPALESLNLAHCRRVADIAALGGCPVLGRLSLRDCSQLYDLGGFEGCTTLHELDLTDCPNIAQLDPLATCSGLRLLSLRRCRLREGYLGPLAECAQLRMLDLAEVTCVCTPPLPYAVAIEAHLRLLLCSEGFVELQVDVMNIPGIQNLGLPVQWAGQCSSRRVIQGQSIVNGVRLVNVTPTIDCVDHVNDS